MSALTELYLEISLCKDCSLGRQRTQAVPGEGAENAAILFVGEAPGFHEDRQGRPFVGQAGKFLNELLASIDLKREDVYIANVIKCRPPQNRDPLLTEIGACKKWLDRQIELIKPRIIVTLGRYSLARFFSGETISRVHGTWYKQNGVIYFAMYHPAAVLHQPRLRQTVMDDMQKIPTLLAEMDEVQEKEREPEQLNMF